MPYPSLTFAAMLQSATRQELEQFVSLLQGYLSVEHKETGEHRNISADTIASVLSPTGTGEISADGMIRAAVGMTEYARPYQLGQFADGNGITDPLIGPAAGSGATVSLDGTLTASRYTLIGPNLMVMVFGYTGFNVGASTSPYLTADLPAKTAGQQWKVKHEGRMGTNIVDAGTVTPGVVIGVADEAWVRIYRSDNVAWSTTAAHNTSVFGTWIGEVY
jgi:hypothetical protein